jgi:hypothetical protein
VAAWELIRQVHPDIVILDLLMPGMNGMDLQQQADAFLNAPYHYSHQFQIAPGQYNFRMVFSPGDQTVGKVEMPLNIAPWNGKVLSMSGIALSRDVHPFAGLMAGLDDSLLESNPVGLSPS